MWSFCISHTFTMSHWSSGLTICFPPQGAALCAPEVQLILWNWDYLLAPSRYCILIIINFIQKLLIYLNFYHLGRLTWYGVSFPINWVHAQRDSTSSESMWRETPHQLSQRGIMKSHKWQPIPHWFSCCRVSLCVDLVFAESSQYWLSDRDFISV